MNVCKPQVPICMKKKHCRHANVTTALFYCGFQNITNMSVFKFTWPFTASYIYLFTVINKEQLFTVAILSDVRHTVPTRPAQK